MKRILFLISLLSLCTFTFSQYRISFSGEPTSNQTPYYGKHHVRHIDTIQVGIHLEGLYNKDSSSLVFTLIPFNMPNNPTVFLEKKIVFSEHQWPVDKSDKRSDTTLIVQIVSEEIEDTLKNDETGHLIINGDENNYHSIRLSHDLGRTDTKYNTNRAFWVEVGSNFDLVDGAQPNNLFSGVFFYKRDIRPISFRRASETKTSEKRLGIFAGIFESKSTTSEDQGKFSDRWFYDSSSFIAVPKDSVRIYRGVGSVTSRTVVRNLGLFFSPQVRLTSGSANESGFHVFASLWLELQWQQIEQETVYAHQRNIDTINMHIDTALSNSNLTARDTKVKTDVRSHYIGLGLPIFFKETVGDNTVHLYVSPIFGFTNQPNSNYLSQLASKAGNDIIERRWSPFYIAQFRLSEENFGLSFTGEVRGLLKSNNPPIVSIALSKKFDLTKFMEFSK